MYRTEGTSSPLVAADTHKKKYIII